MKILSIIYLLFIVFLISGCGGSSDNSAVVDNVVDNNVDITYNINGSAQKGPFIKGTTITVQELDKDLSPTGKNFYSTEIIDDFGSFTLQSKLASPYIEITALGYYFDEITGLLSSAPLTLRAITDLSNASNVNLNILTTLEKNRLVTLINNGKSFTEAKTQVEGEVLSIFNIDDNFSYFEEMDISKQGDNNAILLAISAIVDNIAVMKGAATNTIVAELSEFIATVGLDIEPDGILGDANYKSAIIDSSKDLNLIQIRENLLQRYAALGASITLPPFENYIDSDGDGLLNKDDAIPVSWVNKTSMTVARQQFGTAVLNGQLYVLGGVVSGLGTVLDVVERYNPLTDTWATVQSMPHSRYRFYSAAVDGKIYVFGGSGSGVVVSTTVDVYNPLTDTWETLVKPMPSARGELSGAVVNGKVYLIGGQPTLTIDEYDPINDSWVTKSALGTGRQSFTVSVSGNDIYIIGGWSDNLGTVLGGVDQYSLLNDVITEVTTMPVAVQGATSSSKDEMIYVFGGSTSGSNNAIADSYQYNPSTSSWLKGTSMPTARYSLGSAAIGEQILVVGGEEAVGNSENSSLLEAYYPSNDF